MVFNTLSLPRYVREVYLALASLSANGGNIHWKKYPLEGISLGVNIYFEWVSIGRNTHWSEYSFE